jgi:hypothetical protein
MSTVSRQALRTDVYDHLEALSKRLTDARNHVENVMLAIEHDPELRDVGLDSAICDPIVHELSELDTAITTYEQAMGTLSDIVWRELVP